MESSKKNKHEEGIQLAFYWNGVLDSDALWSGNVEGLLGYSNEELSGRFFDIVHPDDYDFYMKALHKSINEKKFFSLEFRVNKKDGTPLMINAKGFLLLDSNGEIEHWLGFVEEST